MLAFLTAVLTAIAAGFNYLTKTFVGLASTIYKNHFSPDIKRKREAKKRADIAIEKGDRQGLLDAINDMKGR